MQHRQHRVDVAEGLDGVAADQEPVAAAAHVQQHRARLRGDLDLGQGITAQVPAARILAIDNPLAVLGDADGNRLETLGVHRLQDAGGRDAGDRMLIRLAAVQHHNALLSHAAHSFASRVHPVVRSTRWPRRTTAHQTTCRHTPNTMTGAQRMTLWSIAKAPFDALARYPCNKGTFYPPTKESFVAQARQYCSKRAFSPSA